MANTTDYSRLLDGYALLAIKDFIANNYLTKIPYEWNKSIAFGSSGYLKIGSFQMYDSNVTINIDATTNQTFHGTVVIASQNTTASSIGSVHIVRVYDDPSGTIANSLRIVWTSGSRNYDVYFVPQAWSKNIVHIRANGIYGATDICISQTGTPPSTTSGLEPVNVLTTTFALLNHNHDSTYLGKTAKAADSDKLDGQDSTYYLNYNNLSNKPTIPSVSNATITIKQTGISDQTFTLNGSATTITLADTNTWRPLGTGANDACAGNDSRLSNARPASDVYSWAKASTKPTYTYSEVGAAAAEHNHDGIYIKYSAAQTLTDAQKTQARSNIGAGTSSFTGYTSSNKLHTDYINNAAGWTSVTESTVSGWGFTKNAGTVTSVGAGTGLSISGTASVNPTVNIASGYKLPTTSEWNLAYSKPIIMLEDNNTTTAGTWLAKTSLISALADGQLFLYKLTKAGASTTTLNVSCNGTASGAKTVYRTGTIKLTTHYGIGSYILLYYNGTSFYCINDYDANSYAYVRQYQHGSNAAGSGTLYPILTRYNLTNKNGSYDTAYSRFHTDTYIDTSNGYLYAPKLYSGGSEVLTSITSAMVTTALGYTPGTSNFTGYTSSNKLSTNYIQNDAGWSSFSGYSSSNKLHTDYINNAAGWTSVTESTVSGWGFTKNAGTVTQVKVGTTAYNPSSGVVSLPAYPTKSSWNYDDSYLKLSGGSLTGALTITCSNIGVPLEIKSTGTTDSYVRIWNKDNSHSGFLGADTTGLLTTYESSQWRVLATRTWVEAKGYKTTDTNYYPSRSYSTGLQISTSTNVTNTCALYVPYATASQYGVVKPAAVRTSAITATTGGTTSGRYYGVELDSNGKMFVNVPWTSGGSAYYANQYNYNYFLDSASGAFLFSNPIESQTTIVGLQGGNAIGVAIGWPGLAANLSKKSLCFIGNRVDLVLTDQSQYCIKGLAIDMYDDDYYTLHIRANAYSDMYGTVNNENTENISVHVNAFYIEPSNANSAVSNRKYVSLGVVMHNITYTFTNTVLLKINIRDNSALNGAITSYTGLCSLLYAAGHRSSDTCLVCSGRYSSYSYVVLGVYATASTSGLYLVYCTTSNNTVSTLAISNGTITDKLSVSLVP